MVLEDVVPVFESGLEFELGLPFWPVDDCDELALLATAPVFVEGDDAELPGRDVWPVADGAALELDDVVPEFEPVLEFEFGLLF